MQEESIKNRLLPYKQVCYVHVHVIIICNK